MLAALAVNYSILLNHFYPFTLESATDSRASLAISVCSRLRTSKDDSRLKRASAGVEADTDAVGRFGQHGESVFVGPVVAQGQDEVPFLHAKPTAGGAAIADAQIFHLDDHVPF